MGNAEILATEHGRAFSSEAGAAELLADLFRQFIPSELRPTVYLHHLIRERSGGKVMSGPFEGIVCADESHCGAIIPCLIGCYEKELHPILDEIFSIPFELIVNVGAAEGYYACGMAKRIPSAKVVAFEADAEIRSVLKEMIEKNGFANRIEVRGHCDSSAFELAVTATKHALVVLDCEGCEAQLLNATGLQATRNAHLIVETHDFIAPGIHGLLRDGLQKSHTVTEIRQVPRTKADYPVKTIVTRLLPSSRVVHELREGRPSDLAWLYAVPHSWRP